VARNPVLRIPPRLVAVRSLEPRLVRLVAHLHPVDLLSQAGSGFARSRDTGPNFSAAYFGSADTFSLAPGKRPTHLFLFRLLLRHLRHLRLLLRLPPTRHRLPGSDDHVLHVAHLIAGVVTEPLDSTNVAGNSALNAANPRDLRPDFAEGPQDDVQ
jgi:hypothetical protein